MATIRRAIELLRPLGQEIQRMVDCLTRSVDRLKYLGLMGRGMCRDEMSDRTETERGVVRVEEYGRREGGKDWGFSWLQHHSWNRELGI